MPTLIDEEGVRILAAGILQRPEPLETTPDLKGHIGGDALAKIKEFWYSKEGKAANVLRQEMLKNYPSQKETIDSQVKEIEQLNARIKELESEEKETYTLAGPLFGQDYYLKVTK